MNLYKVYDPEVSVPGFASWFMEYRVGTEQTEAWDKPVVIYCGQGLEEWNAHTPEEKGLGGSETWAVKVARELRAKGHPVVLYGAVDGVYDGVIYRNAQWYDPQAPFAGAPAWTLIVSRHLELLDERPNAEHILFMAHDVDYGAQLTAERLANLNSYCVLSKWQEAHTLGIYREESFIEALTSKLRIVQNGIEPEYFEGPAPERKHHSFLWASSPDRGLDKLLSWWPEIREMWPDASLSVCYGWENIDALSSSRPWLQPFKARIMGLLRQPGVKWLGRMGQKALAQEWRTHQFWLYPSSLPDELGGGVWNETFCITALEAAAGGCIGIFPAAGALVERPGTITSDEALDLEDVTEVLTALDKVPGRDHFDASCWSWDRAAESLLACVQATGVVVSLTTDENPALKARGR